MIRGYRDRRTKRFAEGRRAAAFEPFRRQLRSNRLEALSGDRQGQYSIRINSQWRLCFEWPSGAEGPDNVEIVDYH